jgi:diguanylate cyclase (GGDEF)-like protein
LLASIRERNIPHENSDAANHVTISIGVTTGNVEHTNSADDFIKRADEMLYKSKHGGRNTYSFESL